jgi:hypothetical protein
MDGPAFLDLVTRQRGLRERFLELYERPGQAPPEVPVPTGS